MPATALDLLGDGAGEGLEVKCVILFLCGDDTTGVDGDSIGAGLIVVVAVKNGHIGKHALIGALKVVGEDKHVISLWVEARNGLQGAATMARLHGGSSGFDILLRCVTHTLESIGRVATADVIDDGFPVFLLQRRVWQRKAEHVA